MFSCIRWSRCYFWRTSPHLKPVHFSTAHIIVHSPPKDVHGIMDNSRGMEQPPTWHLREIRTAVDNYRLHTTNQKINTFPQTTGKLNSFKIKTSTIGSCMLMMLWIYGYCQSYNCSDVFNYKKKFNEWIELLVFYMVTNKIH